LARFVKIFSGDYQGKIEMSSFTVPAGLVARPCLALVARMLAAGSRIS
jgi:hypothetical protein